MASGTRLSTSKTRSATGPSLIRGAKDAGSVRFQPFCATLDSRNACKGPGMTAAANANPLPIRIHSNIPIHISTSGGGKRVAVLTDNKFQIQTFAGGEIVPGLQVVDAVQNGTVECGHTALYYYFGKDDTFVFASALPFGMNSRMQNAWMIQGGGRVSS